MSNIFDTTALANDQLLVTGNAAQRTVLNVSQWNELKRDQRVRTLETEYDEEIKEFFRPLIEAEEKLDAATIAPIDPAFTIVLSEPVEHRCAEKGVAIDLDEHSAIARLIEMGEFDRLIWVDDSTIAVTEYTGN